MQSVNLLLIAVLVTTLPARLAHAAEPGSEPPSGWLLGVGYLRAPDAFAADAGDPSQAFPLVGYLGERLTWLGPYLSYELVESEQIRVAAVVEMRFEGIEDDIVEGALRGVAAREPSLEAGADVSYGPLFASARLDASGRHDGYELAVALRREWRVGSAVSLEARAGVAWEDDDLTGYLYGVSDAEAVFALDPYQPGSALNYEASLNVSFAAGPRWVLLGGVSYRVLDQEIRSSPIVDGDHQIGAFVGATFRIGSRRGSTDD